MIKHFSAGGLVTRVIDNILHVLVTQHSGHRGWGFPKGHIEKGETAKKAALREVEEETGVKARVREKAGDVHYFFNQNGQRIDKTVIFFWMDYLREGQASTSWEVMNQEWIPAEQVANRLTFDSEQDLWQKVKDEVKCSVSGEVT